MVPSTLLMPDLHSFIQAAGDAGTAAIIFAETGLFIGFFLPGDTLLFTAGILASQGILNITTLVIYVTIAAIAGDSVGYWTGAKAGPLIFTRPDSFWFSAERVKDAERFFEKYGPISIVLARFVPIVRTFVPVVAGVARMRYRTFFAFNVVGGILWTSLIPLAGYYAGNMIPNIDRYILPLVGVVAVASVAPIVVEAIRRHVRSR